MLQIKVGLLSLYSSMKKNQNDSANFWHRKMTLKVNIGPFLALNSKMTERPKIIFMADFTILLSCLFTTKLNCLQKNKFGHTTLHIWFHAQLAQNILNGIYYVRTYLHQGFTYKLHNVRAFLQGILYFISRENLITKYDFPICNTNRKKCEIWWSIFFFIINKLSPFGFQ